MSLKTSKVLSMEGTHLSVCGKELSDGLSFQPQAMRCRVFREAFTGGRQELHHICFNTKDLDKPNMHLGGDGMMCKLVDVPKEVVN